ncbi:Uncharacterised protein [Klebsiella pneumoniae]|nr:Uncharacterised protein [Klebsiella pneumoniae]
MIWHFISILINTCPLKPVYKKQANCFRTDSESLTGDYKENNHDISLTWNGDYWDNEFLARNSTRCMINFLEEYKVVNTDRLHVAIFSISAWQRSQLPILTHITKMKLFTIIHFLIVIQKHVLSRQVEKGSV